MDKGKPSGNPLDIPKNQEFELIASRHFKNLISPKPTRTTVQVELSKLNFNFDNIRTNFLQVLGYYGFPRLLCYDEARQN